MSFSQVAAILVLASVAASACIPVPEEARPRIGEVTVSPHSAIGCWRLGLERHDSTYLRWPALVSLDTVPTQWQKEYIDLRVAVDSGAQTSRILLMSWAPLSSDWIAVSVGDGFSGVDFRLRLIHADTLRGGGRKFVDVVPAFPGFARSITGVRAPCNGKWAIPH